MTDARGGEDRWRLFVALALPAEVRMALREWWAGALGARTELRGLQPESLHLTLCFLGWRPMGEVGEIVAACTTVAGSGAQLLTTGDPVWLPTRRPSVLAVTLASLDGKLDALQSAVSDMLVAGGWFQPEARPFLPHVSVARVRRGARVSPRALQLAASPAIEFETAELVLYRSHIGRGGASYEALSCVELGAGSRGSDSPLRSYLGRPSSGSS